MAKVTVFISYSSVDRMEALAIRRLLRTRGCAVWMDVFDIPVAADLKHELGAGMEGADVLCLLLSPSALASRWVTEEIARAQEQAAERGMRIIAVLLRPCRPPDALIGRVMLDATTGLDAADVRARLIRAVLGQQVVGDIELDAAMQEALLAKQHELEAAQVLPDLARTLDAVRATPIRKVEIAFRHTALPRDKVLAIRLAFDSLFSQPMWFLFAHYREGRTWPAWMTFSEIDHDEIRADGPRIDGRFEWFKKVVPLSVVIDGTDLRDRPATFHFDYTGRKWQPQGAAASYGGGPTVPHLPQRHQIPPLDSLIAGTCTFDVVLLGPGQNVEEPVVAEENDLDIHVMAEYRSGEEITLYRSAHRPLERAVLQGVFLAGRRSPIEREAILGLYPRTRELAASDAVERRRAAHALLDQPEEQLSPEERRVVATLRHGQATLEMFRVFGNAPPPGPARQKLHESALNACRAVWRLLEPLIAARPDFDEIGMAYHAASNLADYYQAGGAVDRARAYGEAALALVADAALRVADEPEYRRWQAAALERLARIQASGGDNTAATANMAASIDILNALYEELPNNGRRTDLYNALVSARQWFETLTPGVPQVGERWAALASALNGTVTPPRNTRRAKATRRRG